MQWWPARAMLLSDFRHWNFPTLALSSVGTDRRVSGRGFCLTCSTANLLPISSPPEFGFHNKSIVTRADYTTWSYSEEDEIFHSGSLQSERIRKARSLRLPTEMAGGTAGGSVADCWEDDAADDAEEGDPNQSTPQSNPSEHVKSYAPSPPPPTPASPLSPQASRDSTNSRAARVRQAEGAAASPFLVRGHPGSMTELDESDRARQEKTDAVAKRMIAGALGMRAPRKTEEETQYEQAMKDRVRKKRDEDLARKRAEEEASARAKAAAWAD